MALRIRGLSIGALREMAIASLRPLLSGQRHVFICIADHYEPMWNSAPMALQRERVERWVKAYPESFGRFQDSRGRSPQHTFFYPAEEYNFELIDRLAELCHSGHGEVEIHLHHENDTADHLRDTLEQFKCKLHTGHALLRKNERGELTYGFIHGNWALDNSLPDGRWCGVNDELTVLRETGCYADFTLPAAPSPAQTMTINSIYYATGDPSRPKSHDRGIPARVGVTPPDDSLLLIQGPTMLDWTKRRYMFPPGLENGDIHKNFAPCPRRLKLWLRARIGVVGRPDWIFVKLHTHGAPEHNASVLLGEPMRRFHETLQSFGETDQGFRYYYVTAREMADLVHQAERGENEPQFEH